MKRGPLSRFVCAALLLAATAVSQAAFPAGWTKRCAVTIDDAKVGTGGVTSFTVLLTEANLPAAIFTDARSDGGDIRFSTDSAGSNQLAVDVIYFDAGGNAEIRCGPTSLTGPGSGDTTIYVWYGAASETLPAVDSAYGQYATYDASWGGYWTLNESATGANTLLDRTVNQHHGSPGASHDSSDRVTGKLTAGQNFDGLNADCITIDGASGTYSPSAWTIMLWTRRSTTTRQFPFSYCSSSTTTPIAGLDFTDNYLTAKTLVRDDANTDVSVTGGGNSAGGAWIHWALTNESATAHKLYKDGTQAGSTNTTTLGTTTVNRFTLGELRRADVLFPLNGDIDDVQVHTTGRSAAWIQTEHNQVNAPATFAAAGTPETIGGGGWSGAVRAGVSAAIAIGIGCGIGR